MSLGIKDELVNLKNKLELLEEDLTKQMMELEVRAEQWHKIDEEAQNIVKENKDKVITLNIGGKLFQTKLDTLMSMKDTIFYRLYLTKKVDISKELFIDRNHKYFNYILSFLRNKKIISKGLSMKDIKSIQNEAEFYEIHEMNQFIEEILKDIKFVAYEFSGAYTSGGTIAGTNNIDDINNFEDKSCSKGICTSYGGWIIFELNRETEFEALEIGGYKGNTNIYASSNGSGATILTSIDKSNWNQVGTVPSNFGDRICTVKFNSTRAKYVKLNHNSYLGVGYFRIIREI